MLDSAGTKSRFANSRIRIKRSQKIVNHAQERIGHAKHPREFSVQDGLAGVCLHTAKGGHDRVFGLDDAVINQREIHRDVESDGGQRGDQDSGAISNRQLNRQSTYRRRAVSRSSNLDPNASSAALGSTFSCMCMNSTAEGDRGALGRIDSSCNELRERYREVDQDALLAQDSIRVREFGKPAPRQRWRKPTCAN
jgi:hypothetical protein